MQDLPPEPTDQVGPEPDDNATRSLRGTMTAVLLMAAFFVAAWLGMLWLAMERR